MVGRHKWTYGVVWLWCFPLRALGQIGLTHCLPPWCSRTPLSRNTTRCVLEFLFLRAGSWHGPIIRERTIVGSRGSIVHEAAVSPAAAVGQLLCSEGARPRTCMRLGCLSARHCLTSLVHLKFRSTKKPDKPNRPDEPDQRSALRRLGTTESGAEAPERRHMDLPVRGAHGLRPAAPGAATNHFGIARWWSGRVL